MKKILATGGMLTYLFMFNSGMASAHVLPDVAATDIQTPSAYENARHEKSFESKVSRLAQKLGLDPDELASDVQSNKSIKQILKKHGITKNQLSEFQHKKRQKNA